MTSAAIAKLVLTAAVATAGVGFLVKSTLGSTYQHKKVDELGGDLAAWQDKTLSVYGHVVAGSIREQVIDQETQRTFVVEQGERRIRVFHRGPKPDVFKDKAEAGSTGRIVRADTKQALAATLGVSAGDLGPFVVDATELSAKCPSRYDGALINKDMKTEFKDR